MQYSASSDDITLMFLIGYYIVYFLIMAIIMITAVIGNWFIFKKAGYHGWEAVIPFYNSWILAELSWGHGVYMFLPFIPCVGYILAIYSSYKICASFGKGIGFTIGFILLYPVFQLILAFDKSEYIGVTKNFWEND